MVTLNATRPRKRKPRKALANLQSMQPTSAASDTVRSTGVKAAERFVAKTGVLPVGRRRRRKFRSPPPPAFKKFEGALCVRVSVDELREGDYCVYWENGWRSGKVKKNHKGYKHRWIRLYPRTWEGYTLSRSKKIKPEKVKEGWRKNAAAAD